MWAVIVGVVGASMSLFFEWTVEVIQWLLTGIWSDSRVGTFSQVEPEWRMFIPVVGGLAAGCILLFLKKRMPGTGHGIHGGHVHRKRADQIPGVRPEGVFRGMEHCFRSGHRQGRAYHPVLRLDRVRGGAAAARIHSAAPAAGRLRAAAGFTTAFPCPFAGCLFVSEIIIGTVSMDILAPLLIASCTGFAMLHLLGDPAPLYSSPFESFTVFSQSLWCIALGVAAAVAARGWVSLLDVATRYLNGRQSLLPLRLMAAGLVVGVLAVFYPEVVGNGQALITGLVDEDYSTQQAFILLLVKVSAVAIVFGCGTVGGP